MENTINQLALRAATDAAAREELIHAHEQTILRTAAGACRRYVTTSDDEWSVALCAFSRAIDQYDGERGDFLPFAQMLIRRELVDYYRSQAAARREISVSPFAMEGSGEDEDRDEAVYLAVVEQSREAADRSLQEEILAANEMLRGYGFRFFDLTDCSPQQGKTRSECAAAVRYMLAEPARLEKLERSRKLPVREIAEDTGLSRKTLDRYRKYIIMAALVLHGEYPQLAEYLSFVREEGTA